MRKEWYNILLIEKNNETGEEKETVIAKVKSKGNAYMVFKTLKHTYASQKHLTIKLEY